MNITPDLIKYLETLSRLELTDEEKKTMGSQLQDMVGYMDMLSELDTDGVEPLVHCFFATNVFRADEVSQHLTPNEIVANAPESQDGAFVVPKTVD